jgi:hypothetical protein
MLMGMDETRLNTIPAQDMSIEERLDEIAQLMVRGVVRLKTKSNKETGSTGLQPTLKHSCDKGDQHHE